MVIILAVKIKFKYPENLSSPLKIMIEESNGASDYGNKFGEPVIQGFTRLSDRCWQMASGRNG